MADPLFPSIETADDPLIAEMVSALESAGCKAPPCCVQCWGEYHEALDQWRREKPCGICCLTYAMMAPVYQSIGKSIWESLRIKKGTIG